MNFYLVFNKDLRMILVNVDIKFGHICLISSMKLEGGYNETYQLDIGQGYKVDSIDEIVDCV
jgi:hypothetical protein